MIKDVPSRGSLLSNNAAAAAAAAVVAMAASVRPHYQLLL